ncbi:MAG: hypothetical protein COU29_02560 [Candidatus Magasanikbacteria bacterium CG10_big_fil_rev_8_21_14_0_10_36_32]|uniref:TrbC/VIRB2 family protein n=1 Tax=Candidatus Magasanikbacteria bacterium CG10_big_fil_rev_8_21_14_0_10_36_32 TaxID=1974646 RepID=A0A2M6W750_9BACT|nr:MAG: hypothetical protein COU29_02560 [Candidatus Magasanikbacteria bacterium CG10_big_fil_rev_8_21_14_0_10_36_32]
MKKLFVQLLIVTCLFIPTMALADTFGSGLLSQSVQGVGLEQNLENSVANVISTVSTVVGTIFLILTVVAGIMWMTAAGNEDKISKAKQMLAAAAVGLFIVMSAYTITYFVTKKVGNASGGGTGETTCSCAGCYCSTVTACTSDVGTALTGTTCSGVCCQPTFAD